MDPGMGAEPGSASPGLEAWRTGGLEKGYHAITVLIKANHAPSNGKPAPLIH